MVFRDNPNATTKELNTELKSIVAQVAKLEYSVIENVTIGTSSTPIYHGRQGRPRAFLVIPYSLVTWCRTDPPDSRQIYVKASVATQADIVVFP